LERGDGSLLVSFLCLNRFPESFMFNPSRSSDPFLGRVQETTEPRGVSKHETFEFILFWDGHQHGDLLACFLEES
jgi:hypothetical protein